MTDLKDMMKSMSLHDIDAEIKRQIESVPLGSDDVKAAIMLGTLAEESMTRLDAIDASAFPAKLKAQLDEIRAKHRARQELIHSHCTENKRLVLQIEGSPEIATLDREISDLLTRYDALLADAVVERDPKPVSGL